MLHTSHHTAIIPHRYTKINSDEQQIAMANYANVIDCSTRNGHDDHDTAVAVKDLGVCI